MNARLATLMLSLVLPTAAAGQQPTFRLGTPSVGVDVSVTREGKPVAGLTVPDFRLADNGVRQTITDVSREQLPVDVTLIADLSGTAEGPRLDAFRRALSLTLRSLGAGDRARLVLFDPRIQEIAGLETAGGVMLNSEVLAGDGGASALLDAVAVSLIRKPDPFYRRMAIVFTDGQDGRSFLDEPKLLDVVARTDMTVFTVALTDGTTRVPRPPSNERMLQALADASGGALTVVQRDADLAASFVRKLEEFRTTYVLRYSPTGVPPGGWHDVEVQLSVPGGFDVRARRGYFGETVAPGR
jgi:VWFA-related protein